MSTDKTRAHYEAMAVEAAGEKVDVLAVMQASADQLFRYRRTGLAMEEESARSIVAELIEAAKELESDAAILGMGCARLNAALERIGSTP